MRFTVPDSSSMVSNVTLLGLSALANSDDAAVSPEPAIVKLTQDFFAEKLHCSESRAQELQWMANGLCTGAHCCEVACIWMPTASYPTMALALPMSEHPHAVLQPCMATGIPPAVRVS